jgi:hypothetical protein
MLKAAKEVRALHLEYGNSFDDELKLSLANHIASQLSLVPLLSNSIATFHHLKTLFLSAVVPGQAFANFLRLHSLTLKQLELRCSTSDNWAPVLYTIARQMELDRMHLYWLVEGSHMSISMESRGG